MISVLILSPSMAHAVLECGQVSVTGITVQADRENNSPWANTMRVVVNSGTCQGVTYAYLRNDHPAYSSVLSVLLAAQATGEKVSIFVKESGGIGSNSKEIEWITK